MASARHGGMGLVAALLVAALAIRLSGLAAFPLIDPTEGRYAEIPREMERGGDWVVPRLEPDRPFWAKPPLAFWVTAVSYHAFGVNEFSARLPSLLFSLVTVVLTALLGLELFGRREGLLAALILSTSTLFFVVSGAVVTDPALTATLTLSAGCFALATRAPPGRARAVLGLGFFAGIGLSILAKGLLAPALVGLAVVAWALPAAERRAAIRTLPWGPGLLLVGILSVPWHLLAERRTPGFLQYYFVGEHFLRYVSSHWESLYGGAHDRMPGAIWPYFVAATLPWAPLAVWLHGRRRRADALRPQPAATAFLVCWMLAPLVFFTFSRNLLITYALPSLPPFALLTACLLGREWGSRRPRRTALALALVAPLIFLFAAVGVMPGVGRERSQKELASAFLRDTADDPKTLTSNLIYLDDAPSADFYTDGRVFEISSRKRDALLRELTDSDLDYFAVEDHDRGHVPAEIWTRTHSLGHFGRFELRRENWPLGSRHPKRS